MNSSPQERMRRDLEHLEKNEEKERKKVEAKEEGRDLPVEKAADEGGEAVAEGTFNPISLGEGEKELPVVGGEEDE